MQLRHLAAAAAAALALLGAGAATAATFTANWTVDANATDPGLVVEVAPASGSFSRNLAVGETAHVKLFTIWTEESWVNRDDTVPMPITVDFAFTSPDHFGDTATGTTVGRSLFHGLVQYGQLTWNAPLALAFGPQNSGMATLSLTDAIFNKFLFGLGGGERHGADVYGKLTYTVAPIPVPAALPLLLGGLGLLGFAARRRTAA